MEIKTKRICLPFCLIFSSQVSNPPTIDFGIQNIEGAHNIDSKSFLTTSCEWQAGSFCKINSFLATWMLKFTDIYIDLFHCKNKTIVACSMIKWFKILDLNPLCLEGWFCTAAFLTFSVIETYMPANSAR